MGSSGGEAETARFKRLSGGKANREAFSRLLRRWHGGADAELDCFGGPAGGEKHSTGIDRERARQAKPEELAEGSGF